MVNLSIKVYKLCYFPVARWYRWHHDHDLPIVAASSLISEIPNTKQTNKLEIRNNGKGKVCVRASWPTEVYFSVPFWRTINKLKDLIISGKWLNGSPNFLKWIHKKMLGRQNEEFFFWLQVLKGSKHLTFLCFFFFVELTSFSGSEMSKVNNGKRKDIYGWMPSRVQKVAWHDVTHVHYSHTNLIPRQMTLVI